MDFETGILMRQFILFCLAGIAPLAHAGATPGVYFSENELHYVGYLDTDANKRLFALYDSLDKKPATLAVHSFGGDVTPGMELGEWVHAHKLDVKVMEACLSSCANYVFTAGVHKIVGNSATIGYHGGLSSMSFTIEGQDKEAFAAMTQQQKDAYMAELHQGLAPLLQREEAFFKSIGVRQDITTWGQQARFKPLLDKNGVGVWTYSQEGFHRFGVDGIEVLDPPWSPKTLTAKKDVLILDVL
jgi:hypothetical protein